MADDSSQNISKGATVAGAGSGAVLASLFNLLEPGGAKDILLILAPTFAVGVTAAWGLIGSLIDDVVADWKVRSQLKRAQKYLADVRADENADPNLVQELQNQVDSLQKLAVQLSSRRVEAIVDSSGRA
ncbi:MAG: hypothetical protein AAGC77_01830 [Pseudomonadota bacterium]